MTKNPKRAPRQQSPAPQLAVSENLEPWYVDMANHRIEAVLIKVRDRLMQERRASHA